MHSEQAHMETELRATATEITNFFWHCRVATGLIDELPSNTVTRSHSLHAVRKATLCIAGRDGVAYTSDAARTRKIFANKPWEKCGLVKEHVVPVSVIHDRVRKELEHSNPAALRPLTDEEARAFTPQVADLFRQYPRAWMAGRIIQEWTLLAWITQKEEKEFDDKTKHGGISIRKRMPSDWNDDGDRFARYRACDIEVSRI